MSLQTYPLGVQRLSQTLWWSGHPKAINKTLMLRHLLVLHPQQKHRYPKMIWKGYMTPFYHGRFGYSTHVISKQQHVGRYNQKKATATPQNHPIPPAAYWRPLTLAHLWDKKHADTTGAPQEMWNKTRPAGDHFRKHILIAVLSFKNYRCPPKGAISTRKGSSPDPNLPRDMLVAG